eukprot:496653-Prorocentrum_lima.AAC.1
MLIRALPDKLEGRVFEAVEGYDGLDDTSGFILDVVWGYVAPGGQYEQQGLITYVREPGVASRSEEDLRML